MPTTTSNNLHSYSSSSSSHHHHHHHPSKTSVSLLVLVLVLLSVCTCTKAYIFIYAGCSQEKYTPSSPFESNLNSFLASVVSSSSQALFNNFALGNSTPGSSSPSDSTLYGLYQCRGDLKPSECSSCMQSAVSQIGLVCPYSYGATLQLEGCYLRYERYDFLGKLDTTVMYKRCSKSMNDDVEFLRRRDDVLADLQGALGFRVSSFGSVQGFSQCLGDLSQVDCSACLAEAVKDLKTLCGSVTAGHVFLAKCYAQYWLAGYYDLGTHGAGPSQEDEVAKTIAIIVGVIAGIAVLIILLSLCRGSAGGSGRK